MTAVDGVDATLVSKCMAFCQALASQGQAFNFSLAIGPTFSFSLDTRSKELEGPVAKKRTSPSTQRRNAKRRKEFVNKKQQSLSARIPPEDDAAALKSPKCDQCDYEAASEKGLRQHVRMKHQKPTMGGATSGHTTPENLRGQGDYTMTKSLTSSPLLLNSREENCPNCEGLLSPGHQCGDERIGCTCSNLQCCNCNHDDYCECAKTNKLTAFCDCTDVSDVPCNKMVK